MRAPLSYIPILPILLSFIAGILINESNLPLFIAIATAIAAILLYRSGKSAVAICTMAFTIGWINAAIQTPEPLPSNYIAQTHKYTATVIQTQESETSRHLTADIDGIGLCLITTPSLFPHIDCGDRISFIAKLECPENRHDLPKEWDVESYMERQGIIASTYLRPDKISIIGASNDWKWHFYRIQQKAITLLGSSNLSDASTEFLIATVTGDDSFLTPESREKFSHAGLAHILALSGLHIGIIATIIAVMLFPLHLMRKRKTRYILTIIILWLYACATGLSPSVTRAVIMTTVYLVSLIIQRRHSSMNALCFAALLILVLSPSDLYSVSFQLSFSAVASILLFTRRLNPVNPRHRIPYYIASLVTVSVSAMIGTGLLSAYYFHSFPIYFLIGNILVVILLPVIIGGGILLTLLLAAGFEATWLCSVLDYCYKIIMSITEFSYNLPGATLDNIYFDAWLLIPYYITCIGFLFAISSHKKLWWSAAIILTLVTFNLFLICKEKYPQTEFYFPRDTYHTNIIARDKNILYLFTTAHNSELPAVIDNTKKRYRDYIGSRDVDSIVIVSEHFDSQIITRRQRNIILNGKHYVIVDNNENASPLEISPDYAIVCRGFTGDIRDVYYNLNPDSIVLSYDLHPQRNKRYHKECCDDLIPVINRRK